MAEYRIFVSHGSQDLWLAAQIAKELHALGATTFLDETSIPKGSPSFRDVIRHEISISSEMVVVFTPWSSMRSWVWIEMGAAWMRRIPILAVFYGLSVSDLDKSGQGKAILEDINVVSLNELGTYLSQLQVRIQEARS